MEFGNRDFTAIMGAFPTGVVVVTVADEHGQPHGITLNSICSVSMEPPLLLICVAHASRTLPILRDRRRFLVNYLARGSGDVAQLFASKNSDKFARVAWRATPSGSPLLFRDAMAFAECTIYNETDAGDHAVILGRAEGGQGPSEGALPLIYFRRQYDAWPALQRDAAVVRSANG
jgi:flavin reductase (DIM6/NTAB) family NADH-FMN oxidoreductase RutF